MDAPTVPIPLINSEELLESRIKNAKDELASKLFRLQSILDRLETLRKQLHPFYHEKSYQQTMHPIAADSIVRENAWVEEEILRLCKSIDSIIITHE